MIKKRNPTIKTLVTFLFSVFAVVACSDGPGGNPNEVILVDVDDSPVDNFPESSPVDIAGDEQSEVDRFGFINAFKELPNNQQSAVTAIFQNFDIPLPPLILNPRQNSL